MPILNPTQLVDEYKKSGEFDRLRRELLAQFRNGEGMTSFMNRVEDIAKRKLESDQKLQYMPEATVVRELMQELDRYPIVERAVADVHSLSDAAFSASIREQVKSILNESRAEGQSTNGVRPSTGLSGTVSGSKPMGDMKQQPAPSTDVQSLSLPQTATSHTTVDSQGTDKLDPTLPEEERTRTVHFIDTSLTSNGINNADPGSPDSAMLESPLTEHASESEM